MVIVSVVDPDPLGNSALETINKSYFNIREISSTVENGPLNFVIFKEKFYVINLKNLCKMDPDPCKNGSGSVGPDPHKIATDP